MLHTTTPINHPLGDNLTLKSVANENDVERVAAFNGHIHGEPVEGMTRELVLQHPTTHPEQWLFVEDTTTNTVVSALCLLPWQWRYENVVIKSAEMGIVGTLEAYRRRGLMRKLNKRFLELMDEGGYDLSQIQGIPYIYRLLGYEYAIPLEGGYEVQLHHIDDTLTTPETTFRPATMDDIPTLMALYDDAMASLSISTMRTLDEWRYLLGAGQKTETASDTFIAEREGKITGYYSVAQYGFGSSLIINEASSLDYLSIDAVLQHSKALAMSREKPAIRLNLAASHPFMQVAKSRGAHDMGTYAWQIAIPNVARFLNTLAPLFEKRIANSPFANLTAKYVINLYRASYTLVFEQGKVISITDSGFGNEGGDIFLPPQLLAPLALGHHTKDTLSAMYPDVSTSPNTAHLTDVLFPKATAFLHMPY
jgi:hypothetical protein